MLAGTWLLHAIYIIANTVQATVITNGHMVIDGCMFVVCDNELHHVTVSLALVITVSSVVITNNTRIIAGC